MTVDEFVESKVPLELQPIVAMLRELMREMAPYATEEISYGIPMYKGRKIFAFINPTKKDITFGFSHGGSSKINSICSGVREKYQNMSKSKTFKM